MLTRREVLVGGGAAILAMTLPTRDAAAQPATLKHKELNRRNASSNVEYRLMFTARKSGEQAEEIDFPGHAYMMAGEYDNVEKVCRFDDKKIFGFFPKSVADKLKAFYAYPLPGEVKADLLRDLNQKLITHRLDVMVAQNGYDAAVAVAARYKRDKPYEMGFTDCGTLAWEMLTAVRDATEGAADKLVVPEKKNLEKPQIYLNRVLEANGLK